MRLTARSRRHRKKGDRVADEFDWFLGIDWGSEVHALCLVDATGRIRGTRTVAHTAVAVHEAGHGVREQTGAPPAAIAVGIETPRGALVDTVIEHGFVVCAVNPKPLDRFRDRFTAAGAKDDQRDAHVLADALRTDRRAFRRVRPDPLIIQRREVTRLREDLQEDEQRLANRLRDQLYRVDAAWLTISPAADEPWLWTILADAPDPGPWTQLPRRRLAAALRAHRIRRVSADAVLEAIRQPRLTVAPGVTEAVATRIAALVPPLQLIAEQRLAAERRLDRLLERLATTEAADGELREHRDVEMLQSLPRSRTNGDRHDAHGSHGPTGRARLSHAARAHRRGARDEAEWQARLLRPYAVRLQGTSPPGALSLGADQYSTRRRSADVLRRPARARAPSCPGTPECR
jgi:hypothetical protein